MGTIEGAGELISWTKGQRRGKCEPDGEFGCSTESEDYIAAAKRGITVYAKPDADANHDLDGYKPAGRAMQFLTCRISSIIKEDSKYGEPMRTIAPSVR